MYTKDKNTRITLRLNEQQFEFVKMNADTLGVSPSEFLRMVVNASMATAQKLQDRAVAAENFLREADGRENDRGNSDNLV